MHGFRLRYFGPVALTTLCLVTLCTVTAVSLHQQHATITGVLRENIVSRRAAVELDECLLDLIALENDRVEKVAVLHDRVRRHLDALRAIADQPHERKLHADLEAAYAEYLAKWRAMPPRADPRHDAARRDATRVLETDMLKPCEEFEQFNGRRIEDSADHHERVLRQLAWGMAGVGGLGGVAGLVLGFGVARGVSRSIRRLQVRVRDAAGKLGPAGPEIVVTGEGDFTDLSADLDHLSARIEEVIGELQQREQEVLRAEQLAAVGQLAAGVAHEIRNPLMSIKMLVQSGLDDETVGLAGEDLRVVEGEVRRMESSLRTFLDFARPPKPDRRPVDLGAVVRDVVGLVRGRAERQRVAVTVDAPAAVPVVADREQLRQVFVNLALNALDAMPTGGELAITVRSGSSGVTVEFDDTGPGLAREVAGKLFQPFVSTKETGLGLGLVISKRIVEDHRGELTGGNRPGGGAGFAVRLPAAG